MHQTSREAKHEVMGIEGDKELAYGRRLFESGLVVIAPDIFISGENFDESRDWNTTEFYKHTPEWSAMGRMLADHQRTIDAIQALGYGKGCLAAIGHSLGGHNALFLAALDKRIDVAVSSAGFERITTDEAADRWARASWFIYMPKLRPFVTAPPPRGLPWDFEDVLLAIHPRSVMILQGLSDPIWTHEESVGDAAALVGEVYSGAEKPDSFRAVLFSGGHEFPSALQDEAVRFISNECLETAP
jgi:hypothetical protein